MDDTYRPTRHVCPECLSPDTERDEPGTDGVPSPWWTCRQCGWEWEPESGYPLRVHVPDCHVAAETIARWVEHACRQHIAGDVTVTVEYRNG